MTGRRGFAGTHAAILSALFCLAAVPGYGQELEVQDPAAQAGRTAEVGSGEVGQRQTREDVAPNVEPMGRIGTRIQNRIESRIRSRIDRDYRPPAESATSFEAADQRMRRTGRSARR